MNMKGEKLKMKDSGIEWIGDIPEGWEVSRCKYNMTFQNGYAFDSKDLVNENGVSVIRIGDIQNNSINFEESLNYAKPVTNELECFKIKDKDILIAMSGATVGKIGFYDASDFNGRIGYINQRVGIIRSRLDKFLFYYFSTNEFIEYILLNSAGSAQPNVSGDMVLNYPIPLPPPETQKRIADFLDAKCGKIDGLKNDIQKQIETLEQYKKSVITEAVTGKLKFASINPNAKMKDSGIEWIGEIPEHWEIHPIYYYFEERKHKNSLCKEQNLLSLSYGNIIRKDINALGGLLPESFNTYNIIEKDDIVIRPTDLQNDKRSLRTGLCKEHGIITSAYITLIPKKKVNSKYFHYLLHSYDIEKVFYNMGNGVRQGLNYSEFAKLLVISPTKDEQKDIVAYLDEKCSSIDSIISTKKQQLEKLEEYKKSLIFEYVTGKKQVFSGEFPSETSGKKEV